MLVFAAAALDGLVAVGRSSKDRKGIMVNNIRVCDVVVASACLVIAGAALAQSTSPAIVEISHPNASGIVALTIRNNSEKDISAYVYTTTYQSGGKTVNLNIFQDECLLDTFDGMPRGGEIRELRGGPGMSGIQAQIRAVLYADGSTFGESGWGERILNRRHYAEKEYQSTARDLASLTSAAQLEALIGALRKSNEARLAQSTDPDEREWISQIGWLTVGKLYPRFRDGRIAPDGILEEVSSLNSAAKKAACK